MVFFKEEDPPKYRKVGKSANIDEPELQYWNNDDIEKVLKDFQKYETFKPNYSR